MGTHNTHSTVEELAKQFSVFALSDNRLPSPASPGYFHELSRVERGLIRDTVNKIRQVVTAKDRIGFPGLVYVAKQKGTRFAKVGYSSREDASRIGEISGTCDLEFEKIYQSPTLPCCAYRAEQILHKVLRQWGYDILNCKCMKEHREWYDKSFDFIITLANVVHTWMRQEPYSTQTWKLKPDWDNALNVWITSQDTRAPMAWSEFFLMGLLLKPVLTVLPGSSPIPSPFWGRRRSASIINVGSQNNSTPPPKPNGLVQPDGVPPIQRSNRTLDDSPFRDANSTPKRPSILPAKIIPSKLPSRKAVDQSPPETPVRPKGGKRLSRDLLNINNRSATKTEIAAAKEDQSTEEGSEEDLAAKENQSTEEVSEKDLAANEDQSIEEGSEEDLAAKEAQSTEEDSKEDLAVKENQSTEEGSEEDLAAKEDQSKEEDSEEDLTAKERQTTEEYSTKQKASLAGDDPISEGLLNNGESNCGDNIARFEETLAADKAIVVPQTSSTDSAKEPPFSDSLLDVRSKALLQDSKAGPKADPDASLKAYPALFSGDELKRGLENEPSVDISMQEKYSNALPIERPAVAEDAAEKREELGDKLGGIVPPTAQMEGFSLGRSDGEQEEPCVSPTEHIRTNQGLAGNVKLPVSPTGKAPLEPMDRDKQNSHDKLEGFKGESDLDFSIISSAKSLRSSQQLEARAVTSSGKARDPFPPTPFRRPAMKERSEVTFQNTYTVHSDTVPSEPLHFRCGKCYHFDGNIISSDNEEILRSGGAVSPPPQCVVCGSECPLFRYLSQKTDLEVPRMESFAPPERSEGGVHASKEVPFEADAHHKPQQSTDSASGVDDDAVTLPRPMGVQTSSPERISTEKAAMVKEQTPPRFTKEPPPYLSGRALGEIQMTGFQESHWNDTDWTGVFAGAQPEPHTLFPACEATKGHESGGEMSTKAENESVFEKS